MAGPGQILQDDRLIETELVSQSVDLIGGRGVTEQDVDGIARNDMDEGKDDNGRRQKRHRRRSRALECVRPHVIVRLISGDDARR